MNPLWECVCVCVWMMPGSHLADSDWTLGLGDTQEELSYIATIEHQTKLPCRRSLTECVCVCVCYDGCFNQCTLVTHPARSDRASQVRLLKPHTHTHSHTRYHTCCLGYSQRVFFFLLPIKVP